MGYRYLAEVMLDERKRLGLEASDFHALRYREVFGLAWVGLDYDEKSSPSGRTTKSMIAKYAGDAGLIMGAGDARLKRH